ncbi:MAG: DUF1501 domain-containing protein [Planctomycetota bacterium]
MNIIQNTVTDANLRDPLNWTRREAIRAGSLGMLSLPAFLQQQAAANSTAVNPPRRGAKSCIMLFCWGGPSQLDTWDMKPDAPAEVRGPFRPIPTSVPGIQVCEHLPRLAREAHRYSIIRSMHHNRNVHMMGACFMLTGQTPPEPFVVSPRNWPTLGSMVAYLKPSSRSMPNNVQVPHRMDDAERIFFAGQHAGFLGTAYQPFLYHPPEIAMTQAAASEQNNLGSSLDLQPVIGRERLAERGRLLDRMRLGAGVEASPAVQAFDTHFNKAVDLLSSSQARQAFDIDAVPVRDRERYGRNLTGQSILVSRRLVEAGVPLVTVICGAQNAGNRNAWDTHSENFDRLQNVLLPPLDQGASALLEDLAQRGMLDETLVVIAGEFGRTPTINNAGGRDHWPNVFSVVMAGGGIRGGYVHGRSDRSAAFPADGIATPGDFVATVLQSLGLDPRAELRDQLGRPVSASTGQPVRSLFL